MATVAERFLLEASSNTEITTRIIGSEQSISATDGSNPFTVYLLSSSFPPLPAAESAKVSVVKRRYSDFQSLHRVLCQLYPACLVPALPEKHSLSDLLHLHAGPSGSSGTRADNNLNTSGIESTEDRLVEYRKQMLQVFLLLLLKHRLLSKETLVHRFLTSDHWSLDQPTIAMHSISPQNNFNSDSNSNASGRSDSVAIRPLSSSPQKSFLSSLIDSASALAQSTSAKVTSLKNADLKFIEMQEHAQRQLAFFSNLDRQHGKLHNLILDLSRQSSKFGAHLNAFSLHEQRQQEQQGTTDIADLLESLGTALDTDFELYKSLAHQVQYRFGNMIHEYRLLSTRLIRVLQDRHSRHMLYESLGDQLDRKRIELSQLDQTPSHIAENPVTRTVSISTAPLTRTKSGGLMGSLSDKLLNQLMDIDPVQHRQSTIAKLKESISGLEVNREQAFTDLQSFNQTLQIEYDLMRQDMEREVKVLCLEWSKCLRECLNARLGKWSQLKQSDIRLNVA